LDWDNSDLGKSEGDADSHLGKSRTYYHPHAVFESMGGFLNLVWIDANLIEMRSQSSLADNKLTQVAVSSQLTTEGNFESFVKQKF
jgi:hypothetical protein